MIYWIGGIVLGLIVLGVISMISYSRRLKQEFIRQLREAQARGEDTIHWDPDCVR